MDAGKSAIYYDYPVRALAIFAEYKDEYSFGIVQHSLRRLWQTHPDESVLPTLAQVLGLTVEGVRGWMTTTD